MHIAVITPAYNAADFLPDATRSVLGQNHTDWSMVIVDDGSTDPTPVIAARFPDSRIRLIRQPNAGVSVARNAGLRPVSSPDLAWPDAVLFLDADDWLAPEALAGLSATLDSTPHAVAAVGRFARVGHDSRVRVAPAPPHGDLLEPLMTRNLFANGGHLLIRYDACEATGLFHNGLSYGEDWEYWTRLALLGPFAAAPGPAPVLYVRERLTGAYLSNATDPAAYRPAVDAIYRNPNLAQRLEPTRIAALAQRVEAEIAWTVGRELIRNRRNGDGRRWLRTAVSRAPTPKRLALLGLGWLGLGQFRPYQTVEVITKR